jgi:hypothetical protein
MAKKTREIKRDTRKIKRSTRKTVRATEKLTKDTQKRKEKIIKSEERAAKKREKDADKREIANLIREGTPKREAKNQVKFPEDNVVESPSVIKEVVENKVDDTPKADATPQLNGNADVKGEVLTEGIKNTDSYDEANNMKNIAETVDDSVNETVKDVDEAGAKMKEVLEGISENIGKEGETRTSQEGYFDAGEDSELARISAEGDGKYDAYGMPEEDWRRARAEYMTQAGKTKAQAPAAAIEALGVEHYYPQKQKFLQSGFTGAYIGSRTITTGTGALYPEGLVDARKRAIEEKAKAKAAADEKYWELADTAPQYDEDYKDVGMNMLEKYGEASGWDFDSLYKSNTKLGKQFRKDLYDYKSRGKYLLELDQRVKELQKDFTDPNKYVPPEIKKMMMEFRTGAADMEAYMNGSAIADDRIKSMANMFRSYQNYTPLMNTQLEKMKGMSLNKLPLAKGTDFNDQTFAANVEAAVAKSSDLNWDKYTTVMSKFYDIEKAKGIVEGIYEQNQLWEGTSEKEREEIIQSSTRLLLNHLGREVEIDTKFQDNKALGWANLRQKKYEFEKQAEWREEDYRNYYYDVNQEAEANEAGLIAAMNTGTDKRTRQAAMREYWAKQGKSPRDIGGILAVEMPTTGKQNVGALVTWDSWVRGLDGNIRTFRQEKIRLEKEKDWASIDDLQELVDKGNVRHQVNTRYQGNSVVDNSTGIWHPLENAEDRGLDVTRQSSQNVVYRVGPMSYATKSVTTGGKTKTEVKVSKFQLVQVNPISTDSDQRALSDDEAARGSQEGAIRPYKGGSSGSSSSSGSGG